MRYVIHIYASIYSRLVIILKKSVSLPPSLCCSYYSSSSTSTTAVTKSSSGGGVSAGGSSSRHNSTDYDFGSSNMTSSPMMNMTPGSGITPSHQTLFMEMNRMFDVTVGSNQLIWCCDYYLHLVTIDVQILTCWHVSTLCAASSEFIGH